MTPANETTEMKFPPSKLLLAAIAFGLSFATAWAPTVEAQSSSGKTRTTKRTSGSSAKKKLAPSLAPSLITSPATSLPVENPTVKAAENTFPENSSTEESVDLSLDIENSFNPYLFSREPLWALLPLLTLLFLGLHLLPIPRRRKPKKIRTEQFLEELQKETERKNTEVSKS